MGDHLHKHGQATGFGVETSSRPTWARLHLWQIQSVRDALLLLAVIGVVYVGYIISVVSVPLLLALALAYLVEPLIKLMMVPRLGGRAVMSRPGAVIAIIVLVAGLVVTPLTISAGFGLVQAARAVNVITDGVTKVQASVAAPDDEKLRSLVPNRAWLWVRDTVVDAGKEPSVSEEGMARQTKDEFGALAKLALAWVKDHGTELAGTLGRRVVGGGAQAVGAAVSTAASVGYVVFTAVLTGFFFYFFAVGWGKVLLFWEQLIPEANRQRSLALIKRMDRVIAGFVRGRITICLILSVFMTLAYWLAGVPAPFVLGPVVGLLFIVPFVHVVGVPLSMLLMFLDPLGAGGTTAGTSALWVFQREWQWIVFAPIGIYLMAQVLDDWVLTPTIQGKTTDLSIPLILFASLAGGALAGVYGLLIAIPAAACLKIVAEELLWPRVRAWVAGKAADFLPIGKGG